MVWGATARVQGAVCSMKHSTEGLEQKVLGGRDPSGSKQQQQQQGSLHQSWSHQHHTVLCSQQYRQW